MVFRPCARFLAAVLAQILQDPPFIQCSGAAVGVCCNVTALPLVWGPAAVWRKWWARDDFLAEAGTVIILHCCMRVRLNDWHPTRGNNLRECNT